MSSCVQYGNAHIPHGDYLHRKYHRLMLKIEKYFLKKLKKIGKKNYQK